MTATALFIAMILSAAAAVGGYRLLAIRQGWFDLPNARSSHIRPVPRGAGIALALLLALAVLLQAVKGNGRDAIVLSLAPALLVALAGWLDDLRGLGARVRFGVYLLCSLWACAIAFSGATTIAAPFWVAVVLGAVAVLWFLNLYNFMDGINGIAATEGVFLCAAALWLGVGSDISYLLMAVVAVLLGFLPWNFPRARVFMGDAGSACLGFTIGVAALWTILDGFIGIWQWLILGGVFLVDATYTLAVRIFTGQRWHEAHRSHAYQRLADRFGSHTVVVFLCLAIDVLWLLPWAWLAESFSNHGWVCVLAAYTPLLLGGIYLKAGSRLN